MTQEEYEHALMLIQRTATDVELAQAQARMQQQAINQWAVDQLRNSKSFTEAEDFPIKFNGNKNGFFEFHSEMENHRQEESKSLLDFRYILARTLILYMIIKLIMELL